MRVWHLSEQPIAFARCGFLPSSYDFKLANKYVIGVRSLSRLVKIKRQQVIINWERVLFELLTQI